MTGTLVYAHGGNLSFIHACVSKDGGIKIVGASDTCKQNEKPLDWNIAGLAGSNGATGVTGATGATGSDADTTLLQTQIDYEKKKVDCNLIKAKLNLNLQFDVSNGCDLSGQNLNSAFLHDANLHDANLIDANLSFADLTGADLTDANLSHANLSFAHLDNAHLGVAFFADANLTGITYAGCTGTPISAPVVGTLPVCSP